MRSIKFGSAAVLAFLLALAVNAPASAQAMKSGQKVDVSGKWNISWQTQQGERTMTLNLKQDSSMNVTGNAMLPMGEVPIKDGKLQGNTLTFTLQMGRGNQSAPMHYQATVNGDTMQGTVQGPQGQPRSFTGKRQS